MSEKGLVTSLEDNNTAVVRLERTEACAKCRACISGMKKEEMFIKAENLCGASVNDWVTIELRDGAFASAMGIMYGIPLLSFLTGLFLSYFLVFPAIGVTGGALELYSAAVGVVFMGLAFLWIKSREAKWAEKKYRPAATGIVDSD